MPIRKDHDFDWIYVTPGIILLDFYTLPHYNEHGFQKN